MFVNEFGMVVKGLDTISDSGARKLLEVVLRHVRENLGATIADVWQAQEGRDGLILNPLACTGKERENKPFQVSDETRGVLAWVVREEEPVWVQDIKEKMESGRVENLLGNQPLDEKALDFDSGTNSMIAVPVIYNGRIRGVLTAEASTARQFSSADVYTLNDIAKPVGILLWKLDTFLQNTDQTDAAIKSFRQSVDRATTRLNPYRAGFIARPFAPEFDRFAQEVARIFEKNRVRATQYEHPPGGGVVLGEMIKQVAAAHLGVVDLTGLNPNVIAELGMMLGLGKETILFKALDDETEMPFDLASFHLYRYAFENNELMVWEPAQSGKPAEEVISAFVDRLMGEDEAFESAKEWV